MENQYTTQLSETGSIQYTDDADPVEFETSFQGKQRMMPDLEENASATEVTAALEQFERVFHERYSSPEPIFCTTLLEDALIKSIFDPQEPRPLILYVHHDHSLYAHIFCQKVLCKRPVVEYLDGNFFVWPWDSTNTKNHQRLLGILRTKIQKTLSETVASFSTDDYPLCICLSFEEGAVTVLDVIKAMDLLQVDMPDRRMLERLQYARDSFDRRILSPPATTHQRRSPLRFATEQPITNTE